MLEKYRRPRSLKATLTLATALLICPGDDIALIAAQTNSSTHPDMPIAARIEQTPKVITVFEVKSLKKVS